MNIPAIIRSSADPERISLFIKALVTLGIIVGLDATVVSQLGNDVANVILKVIELGALLYSIVGGVRKLYLGRWSAPVY